MSVANGRYDWALLTDLYQLNMAYAHFRQHTGDTRVVSDLFYRSNPFGGGYAVAAGLATAIEYLEQLRFSEADVVYLASLDLYDQAFLDFLRDYRFAGDVAAVVEGTLVFPALPLLRVTADVISAHLVETALTNIIGHQTLIATKAARIVQAAAPGRVLEFGLRRAHGPGAGLLGARASVIGGCMATSNVLAGKLFGAQVAGTHAHAWVQFWDDEELAFRRWAQAMPGGALFLVDTYDTLKSGLPNALKVARSLVAGGGRFVGVRLDSGDLAYLSKQARQMMDDAGFSDAIVVASSDLDEHVIQDLQRQGARIDVWGVGTNLITAHDEPALGCVFKLAAVEQDGQWQPRLKISDNVEKVTNPGVKQIIRIYQADTGMAAGDLLLLQDEPRPTGRTITIFDPVHPWKQKTIDGFTTRPLLVDIFKGGRLVYQPPALLDVQEHLAAELASFWTEYRRLLNPQEYPVDLSPKLWQLKQEMLNAIRSGFA
jgi:nicotinate phosphoribosyltransferase